MSVSIQHAAYETIHQLGKNLEHMKNDKSKKLVIEVEHNQDKENKILIKSSLQSC